MQTAAVYIRKSREDTTKEAHRLTVQREQLPAHARAQGWRVEIYDDGHASAARGKTEDLVARRRLEADVRAGRVQIILCIELSRLSRDDSLQDYVAWLHLCSEHRVRLATPSRVLDPCQPSDWMLLLMEGGFSSVEMKILQKRMAEGRRQAIREGRIVSGNPPAPYVYDKSLPGLRVDEKQLPRMRRLFDLAETHSTREIADRLGMPQITVRRAISDDRLLFYQGRRRDPETDELITGQWPAVINADQAERIADRRVKRLTASKRPYAGLLSNLGLFACGYCGKTVRAWKTSRKRQDGTMIDYYGCTAKGYARDCPQSRMVQQLMIDEKILTNMFNTLERLDEMHAAWTAGATKEQSDQSGGIDQQIKQLQNRKQRLVAAIAEDIITFADARTQSQAIDAELAALKGLRKTSEPRRDKEPDWDALAITRGEFDLLNTDDQRELITLIIQRIRMHDTYMIVDYHFPRDATGSTTTRIHLPPPGQPGRRLKLPTKKQ